MLARRYDPKISENDAAFLDKIFNIFKNAPLDELIELSHEDDEWQRKKSFFRKEDQKMDSLSNADAYKNQYEDILLVMENRKER